LFFFIFFRNPFPTGKMPAILLLPQAGAPMLLFLQSVLSGDCSIIAQGFNPGFGISNKHHWVAGGVQGK